MKDIDHKLSREIINTARAHDVSVIKLEHFKTYALRQEQVEKTIIACIHGRSIDLHSL